MKKRYIVLIVAIPLFFLFSPYFFQAKADYVDPFPTQFSYQTDKLSELRSTYLITLGRIDKWEKPLQNYFKKQNVDYLSQVHFYTYLYNVQRDAAFLSYNIHHNFIGSLDPLTKKVLHAFFPDFTEFPKIATDSYSEELASVVWKPYQNRLAQERANTSSFSPCKGGSVPKKFEKMAKLLPWSSQPLPKPPPPSDNLSAQITELKDFRSNLTESEKRLAYGWAGERGLEYNWRLLANAYMEKTEIPVGKVLFVRSLLMMGLTDSLIAVFRAKYTYCVPRPFSIDTALIPIIHPPSSPSYPSGHSAQAGAAETILSYAFPSETPYWTKTAKDSAYSRMWGGVHTPQDVVEGGKLGVEVGEQVIEQNVKAKGLFSPLAREKSSSLPSH